MYSITQDSHSTEFISEKSNRFFHQYQIIGKILKAANGNKLQGIPAIHILRLLFTMVFCYRSLFMQMHLHPASIPFGKDTVYRFLNSCHTNWRRFVLLFVKAIYRQEKKRRGRATVLLSVKAAIDRDGVTTPVRFVYVRNRAKKDYLVLVTTDMELSEEEVVRLYGKRWSIEILSKKVC